MSSTYNWSYILRVETSLKLESLRFNSYVICVFTYIINLLEVR